MFQHYALASYALTCALLIYAKPPMKRWSYFRRSVKYQFDDLVLLNMRLGRMSLGRLEDVIPGLRPATNYFYFSLQTEQIPLEHASRCDVMGSIRSEDCSFPFVRGESCERHKSKSPPLRIRRGVVGLGNIQTCTPLEYLDKHTLNNNIRKHCNHTLQYIITCNMSYYYMLMYHILPYRFTLYHII